MGSEKVKGAGGRCEATDALGDIKCLALLAPPHHQDQVNACPLNIS